MMRKGITLLSVVLVFVLTAPSSAQKTSNVGTWQGTLNQIGHSSYPMSVTITPDGATSNYPSLDCTGEWTLVGASGDFTFYIETITRGRHDQGGRCIDGSVTTSVINGKLQVGWIGSFSGQPIAAIGVLGR